MDSFSLKQSLFPTFTPPSWTISKVFGLWFGWIIDSEALWMIHGPYGGAPNVCVCVHSTSYERAESVPDSVEGLVQTTPEEKSRLLIVFPSVFYPRWEAQSVSQGDKVLCRCMNFSFSRPVILFLVRLINGLEFIPSNQQCTQARWLIWFSKHLRKVDILPSYLCIAVFQTFLVRRHFLLT